MQSGACCLRVKYFDLGRLSGVPDDYTLSTGRFFANELCPDAMGCWPSAGSAGFSGIVAGALSYLLALRPLDHLYSTSVMNVT